MARMTALSPGQTPPPVRMPTRTTAQCRARSYNPRRARTMAWDSSRPVPWNRLLKEAAIFLVLGAVLFAFIFKNANLGSYIGLVIGMLLYVGFSVILAKFGYTRATMRQARARQAA